MFVDSEIHATPGVAIFADSIRSWDPPYDHELVDTAKRKSIVRNITEAIGFCDERVEVM